MSVCFKCNEIKSPYLASVLFELLPEENLVVVFGKVQKVDFGLVFYVVYNRSDDLHGRGEAWARGQQCELVQRVWQVLKPSTWPLEVYLVTWDRNQ